MACYNPALAEQRSRKRAELLAATGKDLAKIAREVARRTRTPLAKVEIAKKVGKVLNRFKMGKHFSLVIADGVFSYSRKDEAISREAQMDGVYVIRTSEPAEKVSAQDAVRGYKSLAQWSAPSGVSKAWSYWCGQSAIVRKIMFGPIYFFACWHIMLNGTCEKLWLSFCSMMNNSKKIERGAMRSNRPSPQHRQKEKRLSN